ncbi:hypothetical protein SASPL_114638 [Salvia splendens]|uniref:Reticulon domain-containing protein n=1 Tax=Salvia splendens TaxID=180675 RepID=A0A8X8Y1R0_SALSN|nr:hypothetical protein SASPL_114638 [Salvia splendens]
MKIDQVKGGIKVFNENSARSTQIASADDAVTEIEICRDAIPKQSPNGVSGKRKTWKSESNDGSPVKIAGLRSESSGNSDEQINELSEAVKKSPVSIRKSSLRKAKSDSVEVKPRASVDGDDDRERKPRSDEDCEEIKAAITPQIDGGDEPDFDEDKEIEVENVEKIVVGDHKHKKIVIEEKKSVLRNKKSVPNSSSIAKKQPPPDANHAPFDPTPAKINTSNLISLSICIILFSFISVLSYLGLVYLAAIFLFRSLISRGSENGNEDCVIGEEEAVWVIKMLLPFINEFLLKLRALFSGDPSTTMKVVCLAVLLFILARCGSSITVWTTAKLGFIGVFTVPKICSAYSSQITAYGTFWIKRFGDAWASCSHKKAVGFAVFALVWNLSSLVARIWAVFMLFVAFKHYQQSLIEEGCAQDEAINCQDSSCQGSTQVNHRTTIQNTEKLKKVY